MTSAGGTSAARHPLPLDPAVPPATPGIRLDVDFARVVRLEGVSIDHEVVRAGEQLRIWLHWLATEVTQEDLRSMGQVVSLSGRVFGKEDDQIGHRRSFLSRWRRGDREIDEMRIRVAPSTPPGEYGLAIAVLRSDNQTHVPITSESNQARLWSEDAILVGTIEVRASSS